MDPAYLLGTAGYDFFIFIFPEAFLSNDSKACFSELCCAWNIACFGGVMSASPDHPPWASFSVPSGTGAKESKLKCLS